MFQFQPSIRSTLTGPTTTTTPLDPQETQSLVQGVTELFNQVTSRFIPSQKPQEIEVSAESPINTLSPEIFLKIFSFLKPNDRQTSYWVNKEWNRSLKDLPALEKNAEIHHRFHSLLQSLHHLNEYFISHPKIFKSPTQQLLQILIQETPEKEEMDTLEKIEEFEKTTQKALAGILSTLNEKEIEAFLQFSDPIPNKNLWKFLNFIIKATSIQNQIGDRDLTKTFSARLRIFPHPQTIDQELNTATFFEQFNTLSLKHYPSYTILQIAKLCSETLSSELPKKAKILRKLASALINQQQPELAVQIAQLCSKTVSSELPEKAKVLGKMGAVLTYNKHPELAFQIAQLCSETVSSELPEKATALGRISYTLCRKEHPELAFSVAQLCSETVSSELSGKAIAFKKIGIDSIGGHPKLAIQIAQLCLNTVSPELSKKAKVLEKISVGLIFEHPELVVQIAQLCLNTTSSELPQKIKIVEKIGAALAFQNHPELAFQIAQLCLNTISSELPEKAKTLEKIGSVLIYKEHPELAFQIAQLCLNAGSLKLPEKAKILEKIGVMLALKNHSELAHKIIEMCSKTIADDGLRNQTIEAIQKYLK